MQAGKLDRRIQFRRATLADDGFSQVETWADHGCAVWGSKKEISDGERWRAGAVDATVTARFQVRWSELTRGITPRDRLLCEGLEYDIVGIKEIGRRVGLELTANARVE